jgi:hypothetical protein
MAHTDALTRHPVPGTTVSEWVIPAREYSAFLLPKDQTNGWNPTPIGVIIYKPEPGRP